MAFLHSRTPEWLPDSDYGEFTLSTEEFLGDDRSLPNRPTQWVAGQIAAGLAFRNALDAMNFALATRKGASDTIENTIKAMKQKLSWMRNILPTLIEPGVMKLFGFDEKIPTLYAEIKDYADVADAYWQTVKLLPLYAPVAAGCNDLAPLLAIYDSARAIQVTSDGEYNQRQNEKVSAREAHHIIERKIFNWYAANYPDGQDQYWTQTPWGMAYTVVVPGGGGGVDTTWGGKVEGLTVELDPIGNIFVSCKKMQDAVSYNILRAVIKIGTTPPLAPFPEYRTGIPPLEDNFAYGDTNWEKGNSYFYQIVAVNAANEMSIPCDPVRIDYPLA
jgi:hypothetical protein